MAQPSFPGMIRVRLQSSRWLAALLIGAHGAFALSLLLLPAPRWLRRLILVAIFIVLVNGLRKDAWRLAGDAVARVDIDGRGQLLLVAVNGRRRLGQLLPGSFAAPFLVILRYRLSDGCFPCYCAVPRDAADARSHRILRVLLRHPL